MTTQDLGDTLIDTLRRLGIAIDAYLGAGLPSHVIAEGLAPLGLVPPSELTALYAWRNGCDEQLDAECLLFGEHRFLPFDEAIQEYHELVRYYGKCSDQNNEIVIAHCFPFAHFQGDYLAIFCDPTPIGGLRHPVIELSHYVGVRFETIARLLQTVNAWFASGLYQYGPVDEERKAAIHRQYNPRTPAD